jgi:hypothetical protein
MAKSAVRSGDMDKKFGRRKGIDRLHGCASFNERLTVVVEQTLPSSIIAA